MRHLLESIAVCMAALSLVTLPLGLMVFACGINGRLADASYEFNLWEGVIGLSVCLIPPLTSFALYRALRSR